MQRPSPNICVYSRPKRKAKVAREMVYRTMNFWCMRPEFETDGAIDESRNADGNEGESSQVVGMMILYRKAEKLEADAILKILFMPNL
jgi:hypothetical protein